MTQRHIIDVDITDRADGLAPVWDETSGTHKYASASGLPTEKQWFTDNVDGRDYPDSANSLDDEFDGGGSINVKWTKVNDPSSSDALSQGVHEGFLYVGLEELGTDNFDNTVRLYQTPPTGTATMTFEARLALAAIAEGYQTDGGEFSGAWVYLGDSVNDEAIGAGLQFNIGSLSTPLQSNLLTVTGGTITGAGQTLSIVVPGQFVFVRLEKSTSSGYTSSNTYNGYLSGDGLLWHHFASASKTFTGACNEVGLIFRKPKSQTGTVKTAALVDYFRRVA